MAGRARKWARKQAAENAETADRELTSERSRKERAQRVARAETQARKRLEAEVDKLNRALRFAADIKEYAPPARGIRPRGRKGMKPMVPVFVASDWHVEEKVDPRTVNGLNSYNPDIARKRGETFFESCIGLMEMWRKTFSVKHCVLGLLGDLITGYIHEELVESNWLSPTEATLLVQDIVIPGIEGFFDASGIDTLHVVCQHGNHGRTNPKKVIQTSATNSFEWLLYQWLATYFSGTSRDVRVYVGDGYSTYLDVYDTTNRFHHGDWVRYYGGVGGLTIPLNKAVSQWNKSKRADVDVLGHFHQAFDGGNFIVNGSLIGWNAFAESIKAGMEGPVQMAYTIRPGRGKCDTHRVFVTEVGHVDVDHRNFVKAHPQWIQPPGAIR